MLDFAVPDALNGDALSVELSDAGYPVGREDVRVDGDTLLVYEVGEADRDGVKAVIDDHVPPDPPPDPDDELAKAITNVRDNASTQDVVDLCDALLGNMTAGRAAGRRSS